MPRISFTGAGGKLRGVSQMLQEMAEQALLLKESAAPLLQQAQAAVANVKPQLIVLAARGSSDNACIYARYLFEVHLGIPISLAAPSVLTRYNANLNYPPALVIGVSQSAAAPDVAAVLTNARNKGHKTVSITNEESGVVVEAAESNIFLGAGPELAVAATKTFTLTLLAFQQLCRALGATLPELQFEEVTPSHSDIDKVSNADLVFSLGRGYSYSIALEAALKLTECALVPCKPFSVADFAHGPIALAGADTAALLFGGKEDEEIAEKLESLGTSVVRIDASSVFSAAFFAQRLAYDVAVALGRDPDQPRNLSKVTRTR